MMDVLRKEVKPMTEDEIMDQVWIDIGKLKRGQ